MKNTNQIPPSNGENHGDTTISGPKLRSVVVRVIAIPPRGYRYSVATSTVDRTAGKQGFMNTRESGTKQTRAEAWDKAISVIRNIALEDGVI